MRTALWRRFGGTKNPDLQEVAFSTALKDGRVDPSRPFAVCFFVDKKRKRRAALPREVVVRLRRAGGYERHRFPTDVFEMDRFVPTGLSLVTPKAVGVREGGTGGVVFGWTAQFPTGTFAQAALLTVGHTCGFPGDLSGDLLVQVGVNGAVGVLTAKAARADKLDAALVQISPSDLPALGTGPADFARLADLDGRVGETGTSLRADVAADFAVIAPPQELVLRVLGSQRNVVLVHSDTPNAFAPGTSGSAWVLDGGGVAMIQLGGFEVVNDPSASFTTGVGQVLDQGALNWALDTIRNRPGAVKSSVAFRGAV